MSRLWFLTRFRFLFKTHLFIWLGFIVLQSGFPQLANESFLENDSFDPPTGFRSITLGMEIEAVKEALQEDPFFDYKGPSDVSLNPTRDQKIIETEGAVFIQRGYFQFVSEKLLILTLMLDPVRVDYFSVFTSLNNKYGAPKELSPRDAVWEFNEVRMSLERPVTLKYEDISVVKDMINDSPPPARLRDLTLAQFLEFF